MQLIRRRLSLTPDTDWYGDIDSLKILIRKVKESSWAISKLRNMFADTLEEAHEKNSMNMFINPL